VGDRARYAYLSLDDDVTLAGDLPRLQRREPPELWTSSIPAGLVGETGRWSRVGNPETLSGMCLEVLGGASIPYTDSVALAKHMN
jgi:hypothetical protein